MLDAFEKAAAWEKAESELDFDQALYVKNPALYEKEFGDCTDLEKLGKTQHLAAWADVEAKAKRIAGSGGVNMIHKRPYDLHKPVDIIETKAKVVGDHGTYEATIHQPHPRSRAIRWWDCQCAWRRYVWDRRPIYIVDSSGVRREVNKKYEGRVCSHVLALWWYSAGIPVSYEDVPIEILKNNWKLMEELGRLSDQDMEQLSFFDEDFVKKDKGEEALSEIEQRIKAVDDEMDALNLESVGLYETEPNKKVREKRHQEIDERRAELKKIKKDLLKELKTREKAPSQTGVQEAEQKIRSLEQQLELPNLSPQTRQDLENELEKQRDRLRSMQTESPNFAIQPQFEELEALVYTQLVNNMTSKQPFADFGDSRTFEEIFNLNDYVDTNIYEGIDGLIDSFVEDMSEEEPARSRDERIVSALRTLRSAIESSKEIQNYLFDIRNRTLLLNKNVRNKTYVIDEFGFLGEVGEKYIKGGLNKEVADRKEMIKNLLSVDQSNRFPYHQPEMTQYYRRQWEIEQPEIPAENQYALLQGQATGLRNFYNDLEKEYDQRQEIYEDLQREYNESVDENEKKSIEEVLNQMDSQIEFVRNKMKETEDQLAVFEQKINEQPEPSEMPEKKKPEVYDAREILNWLKINPPMTNSLNEQLVENNPEVRKLYPDKKALDKYRRNLRKKYRDAIEVYKNAEESGSAFQMNNAIRNLYDLKSEIQKQPGFSEVTRKVRKVKKENEKEVKSSVSPGITFLSFDIPINDITIYVQSELAKGRNPKAYARRSVTGEQRGGLHPHPDAMPLRLREDGSAIYSADDLGYHPEFGQMGHNIEERHNYGAIPIGGEVEVLAVDPHERMFLVVHNLDEVAPNHTHIKVWLPIKDIDLI
jgi:hypothetical protein